MNNGIENLKEKNIIIFGAAAVAYSTYKALSYLGYNIMCFAVSKKEDNPKSLDGIDVVSIDEIISYLENYDYNAYKDNDEKKFAEIRKKIYTANMILKS